MVVDQTAGSPPPAYGHRLQTNHSACMVLYGEEAISK